MYYFNLRGLPDYSRYGCDKDSEKVHGEAHAVVVGRPALGGRAIMLVPCTETLSIATATLAAYYAITTQIRRFHQIRRW